MRADRGFESQTEHPRFIAGLVREALLLQGLFALALLCGCAGQAVSGSSGEPASEPVSAKTAASGANPAAVQSPAPIPAQPQTPPIPSEPTPNQLPDLATKRVLQNAKLTVHVGKTGKLARLGHNHLITGQLAGVTWLDAEGGLRATASIRADALIVDDPEERAKRLAAGNTSYSSVPSAKNISDTRDNMLGKKVLDAAQFPTITATALAPVAAAEFENASAGSLNAEFTLTLRGSNTTQPAMLSWQRQTTNIVWSAAFVVNHQQLSMTPFSALGGALRVADDLRIELRGEMPDPFSLSSD